MRRYPLAVLFVLLILSTPSEARTLTEMIADKKANQTAWRVLEHRVGAAEDAFSWSKTMLIQRGDAPFYCQPENLRVTASQAVQILEDGIKGEPRWAEAPEAGLNFALLLSLIKTFPCDRPSGE
jgi:hypothetical protein